MKVSKISKSKNKYFISEVTKLLLNLGAKPLKQENDRLIPFTLETKVGELKINLETDNVHGFAIFSRFEDVKQAKKVAACNPYSGKYNLFFLNENDSIERNLKIIKRHFELG